MASMEGNAFITIDEYEQYRESRMRDEQLRSGELCMSMFRLDSSAFKMAARVEAVARQAGFVALQFMLLDKDLQDQSRHNAIFTDGYLSQFNGGSGLVLAQGVGPMRQERIVGEGYLRDYFDDMYDFMNERSVALSATA
ncbi:hypothetical protein KC867_02480 [Candidatus Saccharibacteria bacterium]|nr:hypothetical protein [Candidatus Saccharibacteria bacterium]